ncbi:hypothetical protein ABE29_02950 [Cytobacillus firmus]|uniref:Uncharacterized protein n=1 Tax=Cytobacillus firmus DS1 TaxID=1307436 RepID=W7KX93_CYTFI|nr:hypothetical protein [Cytobacillus firmus]EWG12030.1 hypothetical protein PBF_04523 [Cytobacillus firmus DS1]MBG9541801.1 hypothetical protein [Cytobacillus firmus]MBG9550266.1 hypothetical protein [Cytobacillus firmus]MBG9554990.1 hypothetical protein [Cytobacillus firmus]MBG9558171.1 hypothetical protein [Cytobacillus firmus]
MAYSMKKGYQLPNEGNHEATICGVEILEDEVITVKGKKKTSDIIQVDFQTENGKARGRYFPLLVEESPLGKVVMAINEGEIPEEIDNVEQFLMNQDLIIEVKHNKSKETGRIFANVVNAYPLEEYEEEEFDLDTDDDLEDGYPDDDIDIDFEDSYDEEEMDFDED